MSETFGMESGSTSVRTPPWLCVEMEHAFPGFRLKLDCKFRAARTVVFGPSGAGKSSLLRAIAGLLEPDAGRIELHGETVWERERRGEKKSSARHSVSAQDRNVGLVMQNPAIFPHLTVAHNVAFALRGMEKSAREQEVQELLELVDAAPLAGRWPRELSGGQLQRVAIARTLAAGPSALLLDEPFAALDARGRQRLSEKVYGWASQKRVPLLLITHSLEEAFSAAEEVLVLNEGRIIAQGEPHAVLAEERARLLQIVGALRTT